MAKTKKQPAKVIPLDSEAIGKAVEAQSNNGIVASEQPVTNTQEAPVPEKSVEEVKPDPVPANSAGQLPAQPVVTQELVTARMKAELTKVAYEDKLQKFTDLKVTEDNMAIVQMELKAMRGFLRLMDAIKGAGKKPALDRCKMWDNAYNELSGLLEKELAIKQAALNKIATEQARKAEEVRKEEQRKSDIKKTIDDFILDQSQKIASCKTDDQLVYIQKVLGSHKSNASRYQEFLPDLVKRLDELTPLINTQKNAIRQLEQLEKDKLAAEKKGDDAALIEIEDKKEQLTAVVEEQKVLVQETAINQATKTTEVIVAQPVFNTIKSRRSKWKGELKTDDKSLKAAFNAGLLKCEIDPDKLKLLIETLETTKQLEGKEEFEINGIRLFLEKLY